MGSWEANPSSTNQQSDTDISLTPVLEFMSQGYSWDGNIKIANAAIEELSLASMLGNNSWDEYTSAKPDKQIVHLKFRYYKTAEKTSGEFTWWNSKAVDFLHLALYSTFACSSSFFVAQLKLKNNHSFIGQRYTSAQRKTPVSVERTIYYNENGD